MGTIIIRKLTYVLFGFFITAAMLFSGGCANWSDRYPQSQTSNLLDGGFSDGEFDGDENCRISPNILPYDDWMQGIPGEVNVGKFTTCEGSDNSVKVKGEIFSGQTEICVFPALVNNGFMIPIPDGSSHAMVLCRTHAEFEGTVFSFVDQPFQGVWIVERPHRDQMNACLVAGDPEMCPNTPLSQSYWSYGLL